MPITIFSKYGCKNCNNYNNSHEFKHHWILFLKTELFYVVSIKGLFKIRNIISFERVAIRASSECNLFLTLRKILRVSLKQIETNLVSLCTFISVSLYEYLRFCYACTTKWIDVAWCIQNTDNNKFYRSHIFKRTTAVWQQELWAMLDLI